MSRQAQVTCDRCGKVVAVDCNTVEDLAAAYEWSRLVINGGTRLHLDLCPTCAEDIDRAIKAEMGDDT